MIEFYSNILFIIISFILALTVFTAFLSYRVFNSLVATMTLIMLIIGSGISTIFLMEKIKSLPLINIPKEILVIDGVAGKDYIFFWVIQKGKPYPQTLAIENNEENRKQLEKMQGAQGEGEGGRVLFRGTSQSRDNFKVEQTEDQLSRGKAQQ
jgi:hypothetical protein